MTAPGIRERVAVALTAAAVVVACVFGVMAVRTYTQPASGAVADLSQSSNGTGSAGSGVGSTGTQNASGGSSGSAGTASSASGVGVSGGSITIGGFFDISGPVDSSVERDTVRAYMQAVNASGGINGRQVQYVWCDSKYDASSAHACAQYLIAQNVLAVVGITAPLGENNEIKY